ncbi:hypothetical protein ABF86_10965 [Nitrosomonas sp. GH22]|nr:hypothetical protein [Nitrosomonas sp. GH22]
MELCLHNPENSIDKPTDYLWLSLPMPLLYLVNAPQVAVASQMFVLFNALCVIAHTTKNSCCSMPLMLKEEYSTMSQKINASKNIFLDWCAELTHPLEP